MEQGLFGLLTVVALVLALVFATIAAVYIKRLGERPSTPISDEIGIARTVTVKVRKREPMSQEELDYAKQIVADRSSLLTFSIPGALFSVGCFYVFGSLYHLHGATPSERTFLGVFPMLASLNFTTQILRSVRLKRRLRKLS
ncbi:hypothetical protein [Mycobacterium sp. pR1184]|uniref:hypothetical protein n=1 Tax=Mycobacterium sp. pR1184 TaxID=3238981 RepID=UPI00351B0763